MNWFSTKTPTLDRLSGFPQKEAYVPSDGEVREARNRVLIAEAELRIEMYGLYQDIVRHHREDGLAIPVEIEERLAMLPAPPDAHDLLPVLPDPTVHD